MFYLVLDLIFADSLNNHSLVIECLKDIVESDIVEFVSGFDDLQSWSISAVLLDNGDLPVSVFVGRDGVWLWV